MLHEECDEPRMTRPLQRVPRHSAAVVAQFSRVFSHLLPSDTQEVPTGVHKQVFDGRFLFGGKQCLWTRSGRQGYPAGHPSRDRSVQLRRSTPDGLFFVSSGFNRLPRPFAVTIWRDMGKNLVYSGPRIPSMCPFSSRSWPNRAFIRSNDAQRLSKLTNSNEVLEYYVGVNLWDFEVTLIPRVP